MADKTVEILLNFIARTQGADASKQALQEVEAATGKAGDATQELAHHAEKFNVHGHEMHHIFREMNRIIPGMGIGLRSLFQPEMAGMLGTLAAVTALVSLLEHLKKMEEESKKAAEENAAAAAKGYGDVVAAVHSIRQEMIGMDVASMNWAANLGKVLNPINVQLEATLFKIKALDTAMREFDKAHGGGERAPTTAAELKATVAALKETSTAQEKAEAKFAGAEGGEKTLKMKKGDLDKRISDREAGLKEAQKAVDEADKKIQEVAQTSGYFRPGQQNFPNVIAAKETFDQAVATRDQEKTVLAKLKLEQDGYIITMGQAAQKVATAKAEVDALDKSFGELQTKIQRMQTTLGIQQAGETAKELPNVGTLSAGTDALVRLQQHGGRYNEMSKADIDALKALDTYLRQHGQTNLTMMNVLRSHQGDIEFLTKEVLWLEQWAKTHKAQVAQLGRNATQ